MADLGSSKVYGDLTVTGETKSDVTGDLTGNVTGNVTGDLTGNVTGQLSEVDESFLNEIIEEKSLTGVVDAVVYDTSRDSDGGAWRHRCQHTSWYNEPLNTSTRGARKEFPAVAVIVAQTDKVTIYDGDDPSLPMWMVFNYTSTALHSLFCGGGGPTSPASVVMGEGSIFLGVRSDDTLYGGVISLSFITEFARYYRNAVSSATGAIYTRNIAQRNVVAAGAYSGDYNDLAIVNANIREIAMTVLPNAPVDPTTGLPIPTIAVATDGNGAYLISVITQDGTVYDIGADGGFTCTSVSIGSDYSLTAVRSDGTVFIWNDIGAIDADGYLPDETISSGLLGTVSIVEAA